MVPARTENLRLLLAPSTKGITDNHRSGQGSGCRKSKGGKAEPVWKGWENGRDAAEIVRGHRSPHASFRRTGVNLSPVRSSNLHTAAPCQRTLNYL